MGKNNLRKLKLLLWKNIILQLRRPIATTVELILPIAFLAILLMPRCLIGTEEDKEKCAETFDREDLRMYKWYDESRTRLAYFPINNLTTEIVSSTVDGINEHAYSRRLELVTQSMQGKTFNTLDDVIKDATNFSENYAGVITFDNSTDERIYKYSIRLGLKEWEWESWDTDKVFPDYLDPHDVYNDNMYRGFFISLQYFIDSAIIQRSDGFSRNLTAARYIHKFPRSEYTENIAMILTRMIAPSLFVLAFIYTATMIVKELVAEKQLRLKESMKMMGLPNWIHWTAWFLKCFLFFLLIIILQTMLLKAGDILHYTGVVVVFLTLLMYVAATICSLFLLSVFFFNGTRAMLVTTILWIATYAPSALFIIFPFDRLPLQQKYALCLLPNTCLSVMVNIITKYETAQKTLTLLDLRVPVNNEQNFLLTEAYFMLIFDCFLFLFLTWYIENIFPGEYGIPKPLYFPFQPSYWCGNKGTISPNVDHVELKNFEEEPLHLEVGVSIKNLRKEFNSATGKKTAVDNVTVNIFKGQITALLGHNGAGKTTTLSILTGLYSPTAGTATVNGKSILTDMDAIRDSFGICPQHNVLFDRLTVKEHLEFFSALKGVSKEDGEEEIAQLIEDMQLVDKTDERVLSLSGGMKRKLSCAIALVGGSQTVFLDEPTSGMDPYARRATWDVLQRYRENKTIILTTHFMDEADYLGDRIAIMVNGQVYCCGSSLYLKKQYGIGYHLTLVKSPSFDAETIFSFIEEQVPTAVQKGNVAAEVSYILSEDSKEKFQSLFEQLEKDSDVYGITSFGISVTTMEEVFLKVGELAVAEEENAAHVYTNTVAENIQDEARTGKADSVIRNSILSTVEDYSFVTGIQLKVSQFYAIFVKRVLNSRRKKTAVLTQLLVPLVLLLLGVNIIRVISMFNDEKPFPPRRLDLSMLKTRDNEFAAQISSSNKERKKIADSYYRSLGVIPNDITEKLHSITVGNTGDRVSVLYSNTTPYTGNITGHNRDACCNYQHIVINSKCDTKDCDLKDYCRSNRFCFPVSTKECPYVGPDPWRQPNQPNRIFPDLSMAEYILENRQNEDEQFYDRDVAGFTVDDKNRYTVWYNGQGYHTLPSAYSAVSNIILKSITKDNNASIIATNHPLPRKYDPKEDYQEELQLVNGIVLVVFTILSSCLLAASFIPFLVTEKVTQAKHVQFVSGVNSLCYWGGTLCWDLINFMVTGIGFLIIFAAFDVDGFRGQLGSVFLLIVLFALSVLPFVYLLSFVFKGPIAAYAFIASLVMILSITSYITAKMYLGEDDLNSDGERMHHVFLLFPTYAFPKALDDLWMNNLQNKTGIFALKNPGIGLHVAYMCTCAICYFILVILIEENIFSLIFPSKTVAVASVMGRGLEDEDVVSERRKVDEMVPNTDTALLLKDLTKVYRSNGIMAVDHLNVHIAKGECFGLLGINGAGKTTTFGMLTGELGISEGSAYLHGIDIQKQLKKVQQMMGYCPQFDGLVPTLTGREMLRMFARLRGVCSDKVEMVVRNSISNLNLHQWADKMCGTYSGGNKRKLSTALALIGNPSVIFLDEPTSGMDPGARRHLWNTLTGVLETGRSIVLTSHSMEECEALCTKLVIMVNGKFKCLGSLQHIKSRFGQGYVVMLKIHATETHVQQVTEQHELDCVQKVKQFMRNTFSGSEVVEEHQGFLQYHIRSSSTRLSSMFGILEENAKSLNIVDYNVSQTSLDQIFVKFAKEQHQEERVKEKVCCSCMCI